MIPIVAKIVRWGRRAGGSIGKDGTLIIKGKRAGIGRRENKGPTGRALRRRPDGKPFIGRPRTYRNPKLARSGPAWTPKKGAKVPKVVARAA